MNRINIVEQIGLIFPEKGGEKGWIFDVHPDLENAKAEFIMQAKAKANAFDYIDFYDLVLMKE
jgi:hypothetical protein